MSLPRYTTLTACMSPCVDRSANRSFSSGDQSPGEGHLDAEIIRAEVRADSDGPLPCRRPAVKERGIVRETTGSLSSSSPSANSSRLPSNWSDTLGCPRAAWETHGLEDGGLAHPVPPAEWSDVAELPNREVADPSEIAGRHVWEIQAVRALFEMARFVPVHTFRRLHSRGAKAGPEPRPPAFSPRPPCRVEEGFRVGAIAPWTAGVAATARTGG